MKSRIVKIGNSKGVIIPAPFIKEFNLTEEIEIEMLENAIFIKPVNHSRAGWEKAFKELSENRIDNLAEEFPLTDFDNNEWQW